MSPDFSPERDRDREKEMKREKRGVAIYRKQVVRLVVYTLCAQSRTTGYRAAAAVISAIIAQTRRYRYARGEAPRPSRARCRYLHPILALEKKHLVRLLQMVAISGNRTRDIILLNALE